MNAKSKIVRNLPSSGIRKAFDRAKMLESQGKVIQHLEVGRPEWPLLEGLAQSIQQALSDGFVHYVQNRGLLELRQAIAQDIITSTGLGYDPETELIITIGASEAVSMCALALLGPNDEAIIPLPAWNHYQAIVEMAGARPVLLNLSPDSGFLIDPDQVAQMITPQTKLIVINSPSNPTGALQPPEVLKALANLAIERGIFILADDVYRDFVYDGQHTSIAQFMGDSDYLLYVNSFSKSYAMTGWRIGYVAAQAPISDALNRIHQYLAVCGVSFAQKAAVNLLQNPARQTYLKDMRQAFAQRYQIWANALSDCPGVKLVPPQGAFYLFPQIEYQNMPAHEFCHYMLEQQNIAMVPGDIFGEHYKNHVRISYGLDLETQKIAAHKFYEVLHAAH